MQTELINTALILTAEKHLRVCSISCDGCAANISTLGLLGITVKPGGNSPGQHRVLKTNLYVSLDICHMLKLSRNALGNMGSFIDKDGKKISWQTIHNLSQFQENIGLRIENKVTGMYLIHSNHFLYYYALNMYFILFITLFNS